MKSEPGNWRVIVFDFDGTLAKLNIDFGMMRAAVLALPLAGTVPDEVTKNLYTLEMIEASGAWIARSRPEEAARFLKEAHDVVEGIEMEAARQGELFPRTKELLSELKKRSIKTGVITRNCRKALLQVFPDIERYADTVITRNDAPNVKPHPGHLQKALEHLQGEKKSSAMVGDHPMDMITARSAGSCAIGVLTGNSTRESLAKAGADLVLPDSCAILEYL